MHQSSLRISTKTSAAYSALCGEVLLAVSLRINAGEERGFATEET